MPFVYACRLVQQSWSQIIAAMTPRELLWLIRARDHLPLLTMRRTTMIISRVRLIAGLFAVLTPLWIAVDLLVFPREVWFGLVGARLAATLAFAAVFFFPWPLESVRFDYRPLAALVGIPSLFYLFSYHHLASFQFNDLSAVCATGYAFLPFIMLAGLAIFPLTLGENLALAAPMLLIQCLAAYLRWPVLDWPTFAASTWLLLLILAVANLASMSQLAFLVALVREVIRDNLTGCFSRLSGEEFLELQFSSSLRNDTPLAVAFIDLDHFKQINDRYGHKAGDLALKEVVATLHGQLRNADILIRWGGEEFLIILPNATTEQACAALRRVGAGGFGQRPDGTAVTASIGIAERGEDKARDWRQLVQLADGRMYAAKDAGRNRVIACSVRDDRQRCDRACAGRLPVEVE